MMETTPEGLLMEVRIDSAASPNLSCFLDPGAANASTSPDFVFSYFDSTLAGTFSSVFAVAGFSFNLITVLALLNHRRTRRHVTTPFIISLCLSDLLFSGLTLNLLSIRFFARDWVFGDETGFLCQIFPVIFYGNTATTLFAILAVTLNRWVMIYFPNNSDKIFTRRNSKILVVLCWLMPPLFLLPSLTRMWGRHGLECRSRSCTILSDSMGRSPKDFILVIGVTVPSIILLITNISIYTKVKHIRRMMEQQLDKSTLPKGLKEREQRLTKMMFIIFGCFMLTYLPGFVVKQFDKNMSYPTLHVVSYIINWATVVVNPSIYVITQEKYRYAIKVLFIRIKNCLFCQDPALARGNSGPSNQISMMKRRPSVKTSPYPQKTPRFSRQSSVSEQ